MLAVMALLATLPARFTCPGGEGTAASPDGKWLLTCVEKTVAEDDHRVYIQRVGESSKVLVLLRAFPRWADFFWSPSCAKLAVVDGEGSTDTETYLYDPRDPKRPTRVMDLLKAQAGKGELAPFRGFDHLYLVVTGWKSEQQLQVLLSGHGDHRSAERRFVIQLGRAPDRN
jgi:hypothetical protein